MEIVSFDDIEDVYDAIGIELTQLEDKEDLIFKAIEDIKKNGLTKEEISRLFDKIVVFDKQEITEDIKQEYKNFETFPSVLKAA